jgi:hypothetical protein
VARTHAGNLPHLRKMFGEALKYPGFAFVHVLAGCVTYQTPSYAEEIYRRCDLLPESYAPELRGRGRGRARRALRPRRALPQAGGPGARGAARRPHGRRRRVAAGARSRGSAAGGCGAGARIAASGTALRHSVSATMSMRHASWPPSTIPTSSHCSSVEEGRLPRRSDVGLTPLLEPADTL